MVISNHAIVSEGGTFGEIEEAIMKKLKVFIFILNFQCFGIVKGFRDSSTFFCSS